MNRRMTWIVSIFVCCIILFINLVFVPTATFATNNADDESQSLPKREPEGTHRIFLPLTTISDDSDDSPISPHVLPTDVQQLAWFYKPPTESNMESLVQHFQTFILTEKDEEERDALRAQGIDGPILQYLAFEVIIDPGSCTRTPWHNQVADRPGDFCEIREHHADWFLYDQDGNLITHDLGSGMRSVMMDPGNQEWREFWLERARESQETLGWDGVFLDNVEASLSKRERRGQLPAAYPDDVSYQAAIEGFLAFLYSSYFQPEERPLQANIIEVRDTDIWFDYLQHLDGAMSEGWAVGWSNDYLSPEAWEAHLQRAEESQALDKEVILVSQGEQTDEMRQAFSYASYLLVSNGQASFRYTNDEDYRESWLYSNYELDLGAPLGPRYQEGNLWKRDFAEGSVTVDYINHVGTIVTDG